jgi:hypothetical protein
MTRPVRAVPSVPEEPKPGLVIGRESLAGVLVSTAIVCAVVGVGTQWGWGAGAFAGSVMLFIFGVLLAIGN